MIAEVDRKTDWTSPMTPTAEEMSQMTSTAIPDVQEIPGEYPDRESWRRFQSRWFEHGIEVIAGMQPKRGVNPDVAFARLSVIQSSLMIEQERKTDAVAWLASLWFDGWTENVEEDA